MEEYEAMLNLKNAVVLQAVKDWQLAVLRLKRCPADPRAEKLRKDCERFLCSKCFRFWSEADGKVILSQLREGLALKNIRIHPMEDPEEIPRESCSSPEEIPSGPAARPERRSCPSLRKHI